MNVIRLILDFLFYRWLADKTSANHLQGTSLINSSISTLLLGGELRYYCLSMIIKELAKLELLDISKRVGFLLHLITVYLRNSIINVNREKFMWI